MKLPNGERAIIDERKVVEYCLSAEHDEGVHKALLFGRLLGLERKDANLLIAALRNAAGTGDAALGAADRYGQRYVIDFTMTGPTDRAIVRSAWIVRTGETLPRLVTCYIL
jgi:hypothetical protein